VLLLFQVPFKESFGGGGSLQTEKQTKSSPKVPCFPVASLLTALNRTKVNYFSLDVEGYEFDILQTIPFDKIHIYVLSVEYSHTLGGKRELQRFMESKGYVTYKDIQLHVEIIALYVDDLIFINQIS
jgi:hypothetical protein